ncbi:MAG: hypothetical protein ACRYGK_17230, partial [Janthinobacterium lividum]
MSDRISRKDLGSSRRLHLPPASPRVAFKLDLPDTAQAAPPPYRLAGAAQGPRFNLDMARVQSPGPVVTSPGLAHAPNAPRLSQRRSVIDQPRAPYPWPELSRFSGDPVQFKVLRGDYKDLAAVFSKDAIRKQDKHLAKLLRASAVCEQAHELSLQIAARLKNATRCFHAAQFPQTLEMANEMKIMAIELDTLIGDREANCKSL